MESSTATAAAAAVKGAELALLTARVVDAMALAGAQNYACNCKKKHLCTDM